jgi:hypothetical protein
MMNEELDLTTMFGGTDFSDVLPEAVDVPFAEYIEYKAGERSDGTPIIRRKLERRIAHIETYVPMSVFHKMMASQERIRKFQAMKKGENGQMDPENQKQMLGWMVDQILEVWKLTEPDMSAEKLIEGLGFQNTMRLFGLFFGDQLKSLGAVAK